MKKALAVLGLSCHLAFGGYGGYILFQTVPSKAGASATSPYSLLIEGTFPQFATIANGGKVAHTTTCGVDSIVCPADLTFASDAGCVARYSGWEIIGYSPTTGQLTASIGIPTLSNASPVKVYGCVGNSSVTTFQGGSRGAAYDSNYQLALHMEETSGSTLYDSTANANNALKKASGNPSPTPVGEVGAAQHFLGTANSANNDYALFESLTPAIDTYTIEYWTKASSYISFDSVFLASSSGTPNRFTGFNWYPPGTVIYWNSWSTGLTPVAPATASLGVFHYIVFVRNADSMNVYVDGVAGTPDSGFGTGNEQWKGLGWDGGATGTSFNGVLDEVYYSNTARSADYITARFNNLSSPSTFYTVGPYTTVSVMPLSTTRANSQVDIFF